MDRLVAARWTEEIHDEWTRNLAADAPTIPIERLQRTRRLMKSALPAAMVNGYQELIPTVSLPDLDDRHVVAAAIAAGASTILTWNLRDFPLTALTKYGLRSETPDAFLAGVFDEIPILTTASLANARRNLSKSHVSATDFIDILEKQKLPQLVSRLKKHLSDL